MSDSFHMLSDIIALLISCRAMRVSMPYQWRTKSGHPLFGIRIAENQVLCGFFYEFFFFSTFLPEKQIDRFLKMLFLLFYFSVTRKAGFNFYSYAGKWKVAICSFCYQNSGKADLTFSENAFYSFLLLFTWRANFTLAD